MSLTMAEGRELDRAHSDLVGASTRNPLKSANNVTPILVQVRPRKDMNAGS